MDGGMQQVVLGKQGSGIHIPPTVTIMPSGNGGMMAEVTATLELGKVTALELIS
jgi:hypothetical protein